MFVGTGSDVGKSVIATGFCRIFRQDGFHPAPFKAQNMSLNSYATPEGLEIGRAQAVQAEACGIPCQADMNPVLLKPVSDQKAQIVLEGRPVGNQTAREYFSSDGRDELFDRVRAAYNRLDAQYAPIVMEGAGSISEINLRHLDITNMRMAIAAGAAVYLIADIDKGGVFGSCYGTMELLTPEERACVEGIIINKFRGDLSLFDSGRKMLEELCRVPVVGVLPWFRDIVIDEEDAVALAQKQRGPRPDKVNIAVILLERLSNFTDFNYLHQDDRVHLFYTQDPVCILQSDIVILPGSKNTIEDLLTIHSNGVATAVRKAYEDGAAVIGICGGYQMMGETIEDPHQVESSAGSAAGLGLLPVRTILETRKTTVQRKFHFRDSEEIAGGYEIHMGRTFAVSGEASPVARLETALENQYDGYFLNERCWGTYLHGILDNPSVTETLVSLFSGTPRAMSDPAGFKDSQYDKLAALIRRHVDLKYIYQTLESETC